MSALATPPPAPATTNDNIVTTAPTGTAHPLFADQAALEMQMLQDGASRFHAAATKARASGNETRLSPVRQLLNHWLEPLAKRIAAHNDPLCFVSKRGRPEQLRSFLTGLDAVEVAHVVLSIMLDEVHGAKGGGDRNFMKVGTAISRAVEGLRRRNAWIAHNPGFYSACLLAAKRRGQTPAHQASAQSVVFNKHVKDSLPDWHDWEAAEVGYVGGSLLALACEATDGRFARHVFNTGMAGKATKTGTGKGWKDCVLTCDAATLATIAANMDRAAVSRPLRLPTIIPPRPWSREHPGGYWTNIIKPVRLINGKRGATKGFDYAALHPALNVLQGTAFRINQAVLAVATALHGDAGQAGASRYHGLSIGPQPREYEARLPATATKEERKPWSRRKRDAHEFNHKHAKSIDKPRRVLAMVAEHLAKLPAFHFPHYSDANGRLYVATEGLSPQGIDLERGLLQFAHPCIIGTVEAANALKAECANRFGHDKASFAARVQWADDNRDMLAAIAADPISRRADWQTVAGKPNKDMWQALAAAIEVASLFQHGMGMESRLVCRVDCTASGQQHFAALLRDEAAGRAVNLLAPASPAAPPSDIYQHVADLLPDELALFAMGANNTHRTMATIWQDRLRGANIRTLAKAVTMNLPNGMTLNGSTQAVVKWMEKEAIDDPRFQHAPTTTTTAVTDAPLKSIPQQIDELADGNSSPAKRHRAKLTGQELGTITASKAASFLAARLRTCAGRVVPAAPQISNYLRDMAKLAAVQPLTFPTATGFQIENRRIVQRSSRHALAKSVIKGATFSISHSTEERARGKELNAIISTFIQSLDAALLHRTLILADAAGVEAVTTIHDSFGCHAGDMGKLQACIRKAFIWLHDANDPLADFHKAARASIDPARHGDMPGVPARGTLDLKQVLHSLYLAS